MKRHQVLLILIGLVVLLGCGGTTTVVVQPPLSPIEGQFCGYYKPWGISNMQVVLCDQRTVSVHGTVANIHYLKTLTPEHFCSFERTYGQSGSIYVSAMNCWIPETETESESTTEPE